MEYPGLDALIEKHVNRFFRRWVIGYVVIILILIAGHYLLPDWLLNTRI